MQWSNTNDSANAVNWVAEELNQGSGKIAIVANNTALFGNVTPGAFLNPHPSSSDTSYYKKKAVGQFAVEANQISNTGGEGSKIAHAGFVLRTAGMGGINGFTFGGGSGYTNNGIVTITATGTGVANAYGIITTNSTGGIVSIAISNNGGTFANVSSLTISNPNGAINAVAIVTHGAGYNTGDIITFSGGGVNATATIVANATGNVTSAVVVIAGAGFPAANASTTKTVLAANGSATGNGISSVTVSAGGTGYNNTDIITFGNGTVNALGTPSTNATGGIGSITVTNAGSGFAGPTNTTIIASNSTGGASSGSGATLVPVESSATFSVIVDAGTLANVAVTLGGRAGRVQYETLVALSSVGHGTGSNNTWLPN